MCVCAHFSDDITKVLSLFPKTRSHQRRFRTLDLKIVKPSRLSSPVCIASAEQSFSDMKIIGNNLKS